MSQWLQVQGLRDAPPSVGAAEGARFKMGDDSLAEVRDMISVVLGVVAVVVFGGYSCCCRINGSFHTSRGSDGAPAAGLPLHVASDGCSA